MNVGSGREMNCDASDEKVCLQPFGSDKVDTCRFIDSRYEAVNLNRPIASNNALTRASYYFIFFKQREQQEERRKRRFKSPEKTKKEDSLNKQHILREIIQPFYLTIIHPPPKCFSKRFLKTRCFICMRSQLFCYCCFVSKKDAPTSLHTNIIRLYIL